MAKRRENGGNKSELIRAAMEQGIISPKDISAYLKDSHGVEASPAYVSTIKSNMKRKGAEVPKMRGGRGRKPAAPAAASNGAGGIQAGIDFVKSSGGIAEARKTLDLLEQISSSMRG